MATVILDPYIVKTVDDITPNLMFGALVELYPQYFTGSDQAVIFPEITKWLFKLKKKPMTALSTGGTNSFRGVCTCSLLHVLKVQAPKAVRVRMHIAWAILHSPVAMQKFTPMPAELQEELNLSGYEPIIPASIPMKPRVFSEKDIVVGRCFSGESNDSRYVLFIEDGEIYYESFSMQSNNHYANRQGVSEGGYPVFKSLLKPFLIWAKHSPDIASIDKPGEPIPKQFLGSIFTYDEMQWRLTKIEGRGPFYYMLWGHYNGETWGHRNRKIDWSKVKIIDRPTPGSCFLVHEHSEMTQYRSAF